jgi:hypothetical protein
MKVTNLGTPIASRRLTFSDGRTITVRIGKPRKFPDGTDYYCPYKIAGIGDERIRYAGGVDAVQALQLTLARIGSDLYTSDEAKSRALRWEGGSIEGDLGFPVPNVIADLPPR